MKKAILIKGNLKECIEEAERLGCVQLPVHKPKYLILDTENCMWYLSNSNQGFHQSEIDNIHPQQNDVYQNSKHGYFVKFDMGKTDLTFLGYKVEWTHGHWKVMEKAKTYPYKLMRKVSPELNKH